MLNFLKEDLNDIWSDNLSWKNLNNKVFLVIGASGLIGTAFIYSLLDRNQRYHAGIKIIALARNEQRLREKFGEYSEIDIFAQNVCESINIDEKVDYIIHAACDVQPKTSVPNPVGACKTILDGTLSVCEVAIQKKAKVINLSSINIYGKMDAMKPYNDTMPVLIPLDDSRYAYHEGKRMSEMICASYHKQHGLEYSNLRIGRVYGPTMNITDSMVLSSFLYEAVRGRDLTIKSDGKQVYTYVYVMDVVSAIYYLLFKGKNRSYNCGEAEEIESKNFGEIVQLIADINNVTLNKDVLSTEDKKVYSNTEYCVMTSENLYELGWKKKNNIEEGIRKTSRILGSMYGVGKKI